MTQCSKGYQYPSIFVMIKTINNESPKMLLVHQTEFDRMNNKPILDKPHTEYLKMLYNQYILNNKQQNISKPIVNKHIGMKMFQSLTQTKVFEEEYHIVSLSLIQNKPLELIISSSGFIIK